MKKIYLLITLSFFSITARHAQAQTIFLTGNVGIGTPAPEAKFTISQIGNGWYDGLRINRDASNYLTLTEDGTDIRLKNWGSGGMNFYTSAGLMTMLSNGYVGIGTTPSEALDVNGTARLRAIPQDNALGKLLVSDANGKVWWRDVASLTASLPGLPYNISATTSIGVGSGALVSNTTGSSNSALGYQSLYLNNTGTYNTANGAYSMSSNTTGSNNSAVGTYSLGLNTTGSSNTGIGQNSLSSNTTGYGNTAIGDNSLNNITTGTLNTAIGYYAGPSSNNLSNTTALGNAAIPTASNSVRIGNSSVTSIGGQVSWSTLSDGRFKTNIKEDVSGLEFINQLKPVSYSIDQDKLDSFLGIPEKNRYRDPAGRSTIIRQTGFVAQDVEKVIKQSGYVFHGVEAPQNDKDHYGIRYAEFVVPLVKAVQELSAKVEEQQKMIEALKNGSSDNSLKDSGSLSDEIQLFQNNPNPFRQDTEIHMNIPRKVQNAVLVIYDLSGKQIDKRNITERGQVITKVEGGRLAAGMYLYSLVADNYVSDAKRMVLTE